jgi:hypothetical protein
MNKEKERNWRSIFGSLQEVRMIAGGHVSVYAVFGVVIFPATGRELKARRLNSNVFISK